MMDLDINISPFSVIKWSYKVGSWIGNNLASDDLLSQMAHCLKSAIDSSSNEESLRILKIFMVMSGKYTGTQKYQDIVFHYMNAQGYLLYALCLWVKYVDDLEKLEKAGDYFENAKSHCEAALDIKTTIFTVGSTSVKDIQKLARKELGTIRIYSDKWMDCYRNQYYNTPARWLDFNGFIRDNVNGCMLSYVYKTVFSKIKNSIWNIS